MLSNHYESKKDEIDHSGDGNGYQNFTFRFTFYARMSESFEIIEMNEKI